MTNASDQSTEPAYLLHPFTVGCILSFPDEQDQTFLISSFLMTLDLSNQSHSSVSC